jgi:hypothetical protein
LLNKSFFARERNYFIQIVHEGDPVLNPQYYQLKRLARKKGQPLFPFKLRLSDFIKQTDPAVHESLVKAFGNIGGDPDVWA